MEEGSGGGCGGSSSSSTLLSGGGRQRFEVELRPGETTIVSWKKLVKDANKAANVNRNNVPPAPAPPEHHPVAASPVLDSRIAPAPGEIAKNEANDAPPGSRFSAVIEKIERLYMGKNSSDEEDLNDVPEDDEYDTEDSFIDDTELDEYFQVDNSAIKHDGFFVNRGKLERISVSQNESTGLPSQQPKKRRRKDSAKGHVGSDDGNEPNKLMKFDKNAAGKIVPSVEKNFTSQSHSIAPANINCEDLKRLSPVIALGTVVKKPSEAKNTVDLSPARVLNGENIDKQKTGVLQSSNHVTKLKDGSPSSVSPGQRYTDKSSNVQSKSQSGRLLTNSEEVNQSAQPRDKNVIRERSDIKAPENTQQAPKNPLLARKEGSSAKSKITMLEKAIRDLEKIVAESRPPSMEVHDADNSSQAVKRRMAPEIKQKLAKVARLAHAIHGKISKELLNRLMSIVGHLIQIRSLKRNLKNMVSMGLSAKEEKDARLQQLKKEVDEMVKIRAPMMRTKAIEQEAGSSDDFQETSTKEKEALKRRITMDDVLEDKICDLYDLFVDGLDEDAGPQVRKLYAELAELWPKGFMDNHGIKRAICRAKDRRKTVYRHKDQEHLKRKKLLAPKTETIYVEAGSVARHQLAPDKLVTDSANNNSTTAVNRSISKMLAANAAAGRMPNSSVNNPIVDRPKQEKLKGNSNHQIDVKASEVVVKKKVKRNQQAELGETHIRPQKSISAQGEERQQSNKQTTDSLPRPVPMSSSVAVPAVSQLPSQTLNSSADMLQR